MEESTAEYTTGPQSPTRKRRLAGACRSCCTRCCYELNFEGVDTSGVYNTACSNKESWACALACMRSFLGVGVIATSAWAWAGPVTARDPLGLRMVELTSWGLLMTTIFFLSSGFAYFASRWVFGDAAGALGPNGLIAPPAKPAAAGDTAIPPAYNSNSGPPPTAVIVSSPSYAQSSTRAYVAPPMQPPLSAAASNGVPASPGQTAAAAAAHNGGGGGGTVLPSRACQGRCCQAARASPRYNCMEAGWRRFCIVAWEVAFAYEFVITVGEGGGGAHPC